MSGIILNVSELSKSFGRNVVLKNIDFDIRKGEVHALIGENGAGKSTLINIIGGIHVANGGKISMLGKDVNFSNPIQAMEAGISIVHQELSLMPNLSIAQNMFLKREKTNKFGFIKWKNMRAEAKEVFVKIGIEIDPDKLVGELSVGMQQIVEIAKAMALDSKLIIMDEPTSSLSEKETQRLFELIRGLKEQGTSVVYISHKINEIMEISDRVSVLRDGIMISTTDTTKATSNQIVHDMVGRELEQLYPEKGSDFGDVIMECNGLSRFGYFENVNFTLRKGEILGFYGLVGAGRTEVVRAIAGIDKLSEGKISIEGKSIHNRNPKQAIKNGICYLTEDRKACGLFLEFSVRDNLVSSNHDNYFSKIGLIKNKDIMKESDRLSEELSVYPKNDQIEVMNLSGGNQQKVLLGKFISPEPKILIVDEPTRGVDVGAKVLIHQKLRTLANSGMAIILISSEMPEALGLSDRIAVFRQGRLVTILDEEECAITQKDIMVNAIK